MNPSVDCAIFYATGNSFRCVGKVYAAGTASSALMTWLRRNDLRARLIVEDLGTAETRVYGPRSGIFSASPMQGLDVHVEQMPAARSALPFPVLRFDGESS